MYHCLKMNLWIEKRRCASEFSFINMAINNYNITILWFEWGVATIQGHCRWTQPYWSICYQIIRQIARHFLLTHWSRVKHTCVSRLVHQLNGPCVATHILYIKGIWKCMQVGGLFFLGINVLKPNCTRKRPKATVSDRNLRVHVKTLPRLRRWRLDINPTLTGRIVPDQNIERSKHWQPKRRQLET